MKKTIRLIHWNEKEAAEKARGIDSGKYRTIYQLPAGGKAMRDLFIDPAAAFVIDLSRLPSQGRDLGLILRKTKATRYIPIIFAGGNPEKVKSIKAVLPDAVYTEWDAMNQMIEQAMKQKPADPVVPKSVFDVYKETPLIRKLGIKSKMKVGLLEAPDGFEQTLGVLPEGVKIGKVAEGACDLLLWFVKSRKELDHHIKNIAVRQDYKSVWIIWPKKGVPETSDLTQHTVRRIGLAEGLVDYKICSVDRTWSGLLFTRRKK
jgi:hypothetical protein